jgi:hypothetical protein
MLHVWISDTRQGGPKAITVITYIVQCHYLVDVRAWMVDNNI